jgi:hypothetical protein
MYSKSSVSSYARGTKPKKSYKRNILPFGAVGAQAALSTITEGAKEIWRRGKKSKLGRALKLNPGITIDEAYKRLKSVGWIVVPTEDGIDLSNGKRLQRHIRYQDKLGSLVDSATVQTFVVLGQNRIQNPGRVPPEIEDLSKEWHGRKVGGQTEIEEIENYEDDLVHLGELEELGIWAADGSMYTITFKKDRPILTCDSDGQNLEVVGGDQNLDLKDLGVDVGGKRLIPLGYIYSIVYETDKHHLEGSNGYPESYEHYFAEDFYKEVLDPAKFKDTDKWFMELVEMGKVQDAIEEERLPIAVYNKSDGKILISGGGYSVTELGIKD